MSLPNRDQETGIRYGYIAADSLDQDVLHELMYGPQATDIHWEDARQELMASYIMGNIDDGADEEDDIEDEIERRLEELSNGWYDDEPIHEGELDGVQYRTSWLGGALHVWVFSSPRTAFFQECSPCVPGAGNLDCPDVDGVLTYDVPFEWRASE